MVKKMKNTVQVTVVIPTYNAVKTIKKCVLSLKKQKTSYNYQVLIVNDGSTDNTQTYVEKLIKGDSHFKLYSKANSGLSGARNFGIEHTQSELITFVDPDDFVEPNYIENLVSVYLQNDDCSLAITGYQKEDEQGNIIFKSDNNGITSMTSSEAMFQIFVTGGFEGFTWNKLYRTDIIKNNKLTFEKDTQPYEDLYFDLKYLEFCQKIVWDNTITYHYIVHDTSALHTNQPGKPFNPKIVDSIQILKSMFQLIPSDNSEAVEALKAKVCWDEISILRTIYAAPNAKKEYSETIDKIRKDNLNYRQAFLNNKILGKRDIIIYWLNWCVPSLFAWLWVKLGMHGKG